MRHHHKLAIKYECDMIKLGQTPMLDVQQLLLQATSLEDQRHPVVEMEGWLREASPYKRQLIIYMHPSA